MAAVFTLLVISFSHREAAAFGDTRTLSFYHNHTKETLTVTFRRNGQYDQRALEQLNWFLRDWRRDEQTTMDPRLFDTIWEVYQEVGSREVIRINSAYRSPNTNAMLRRRSSAVAKNSQHMRGKAMDFFLPDISIEKIRAAGMRLQNGGVGYYPSAYTPFIHLDVGGVRAWPRMTRDQLVRIFPDGKTVHIPADGQPLARYEEARAEVLAKGGTVAGVTMVADADESATGSAPRKSFWASLFGGDDDEDADEVRAVRGREVYVAKRAPPPNLRDNDSVYAALQPAPAPAQPASRRLAPAPVEEAPAVVADLQKPLEDDDKSALPQTRIAGPPTTIKTPSGPQLAWQEGSASQGSTLPGSGREVGLTPMPPPRPDGEQQAPLAVAALSFAPLPPVRPGSLTLAALTAPLPTSSTPPRQELPLVAGVAHPPPPPRPDRRPASVAVASLAPVSVASPPASKAAIKEDRTQIRELTATASIVPKTNPNVQKVAPALAPSTGFNTGFSNKPVGDLSPTRFSGSALKPTASKL